MPKEQPKKIDSILVSANMGWKILLPVSLKWTQWRFT
jgi:hypothetical protein